MERVVAQGGGPFYGVDFSTPPWKLGLSASEYSRNVIVARDGTLQRRPGFQSFYAGTGIMAPNGLGQTLRAIEAGSAGGCTLVQRGQNSSVFDTYAVSSFGALFAVHQRGRVDGGVYRELATPQLYLPGGYLAAGSLTKQASGGAAPVAVAGSPTGGMTVLAVPFDERLMIPGCDGVPSRVRFSESGNPDSWPASYYVDVATGQNAQLKGGMIYRDIAFVWGDRDVWAFYGISTDSTGGPEFLYRKIGLRCGRIHSGVAMHDGMYLLTDRGLMRSQGGDFQDASGPIAGLFTSDRGMVSRGIYAPIAHGANSFLYAGSKLHACGEQLVIATGSTGSGHRPGALVKDNATGQWSFWLGDFSLFGSAMNGAYDAPVIAGLNYSNGAVHTATSAGALDTNDGAQVYSDMVWLSGEVEGAGAGQEWTLREMQALGFGDVTIETITDRAASGAPVTVTTGIAGVGVYPGGATQPPQTAHAYRRVAQKGQRHQVRLSGMLPTAYLSRLLLMGDHARDPTVRKGIT